MLHRNFWFCTIDDPSTLSTLPTVGVDHVMFETDYPHGDGTWPDSQQVFARRVRRAPGRLGRQDQPRERGPPLPPPAPRARLPPRRRPPLAALTESVAEEPEELLTSPRPGRPSGR